MLSGEPPFKGVNDSEILEKVKNAQLEFKKTVWGTISIQAKSLIKAMLERNVKKRLNIEQVTEHEWFNVLQD